MVIIVVRKKELFLFMQAVFKTEYSLGDKYSVGHMGDIASIRSHAVDSKSRRLFCNKCFVSKIRNEYDGICLYIVSSMIQKLSNSDDVTTMLECWLYTRETQTISNM